jgi:hypothetical protein
MRKTFIGAKFDAESLRLLQVMAQAHENNLSRTMRECVREAARARGLVYEGANDARR